MTLAAGVLDVPAPWRRALLTLGVLLVVVLVVYRETGAAMVAIWARSDTFAHAFLVPPIAAWLIWRRRHRLAPLLPRTSAWAVPVFALAGLGWLLGQLSASNALAQLGFVTLLVAAVLAVIGGRAARVIAFPLAFLYFAVPIGEFVMPQLMVWTADVTVTALRWSGIPVYRDGLDFVIPSGSWSVVEACSGVRYLIASFMVGTLFAYLNYRSPARRLGFIAVAIVVPVVANWIRAYLIVMLGHHSGNRIAVGADHLIYGWIFFGVVIAVLYGIGARFTEPPAVTVADASRPLPTLPVSHHRVQAAVIVALAVLALAPAGYVRHLETFRADSHAANLPAFDLRAAGWDAVALPRPGWKPLFRHASAEVLATYAKHGRPVGLYAAYYADQDFDRKLVSSANVLVGSLDPDWMLSARHPQRVEIGPRVLALRAAELRSRATVSGAAGDRLVVWQFYWINGRLTSSDARVKAYGVLDKLLGRGDDAAVVILHVRGEPREEAERLLASFLADNVDAIDAHLARTWQARFAPPASGAQTALKETFK